MSAEYAGAGGGLLFLSMWLCQCGVGQVLHGSRAGGAQPGCSESNGCRFCPDCDEACCVAYAIGWAIQKCCEIMSQTECPEMCGLYHLFSCLFCGQTDSGCCGKQARDRRKGGSPGDQLQGDCCEGCFECCFITCWFVDL